MDNMEEDWDSPSSQLFTAVGSNKTDQVMKLLAGNINVNEKDYQGRTPLHAAVENRCGEVIRLLLSNGADVNAEDSSKHVPAEIARTQEYYDIYKLLYMIETTNWRPGLDPDLMLTPCPQELDSRAKTNLIFERSQILLQLQDVNLERYFTNFEKNNIDWLQFMRLDDDCLQQIGILNSDDRGVILELIQAASVRKWQDTSVLPSCMQKDLTSYEVTCVLKNLQSHSEIIVSRGHELQARIMERPEMLRQDMEIVPIDNLGFAIDEANELVDKLTNSLQELSDSVLENKSKKKIKTTHKNLHGSIPFLTLVGLLTSVLLVGARICIRLRS